MFILPGQSHNFFLSLQHSRRATASYVKNRGTKGFFDGHSVGIVMPCVLVGALLVMLVTSYVVVVTMSSDNEYALKDLELQKITLEKQQKDFRQTFDGMRSLESIAQADGVSSLEEVKRSVYIEMDKTAILASKR